MLAARAALSEYILAYAAQPARLTTIEAKVLKRLYLTERDGASLVIGEKLYAHWQTSITQQFLLFLFVLVSSLCFLVPFAIPHAIARTIVQSISLTHNTVVYTGWKVNLDKVGNTIYAFAVPCIQRARRLLHSSRTGSRLLRPVVENRSPLQLLLMACTMFTITSTRTASCSASNAKSSVSLTTHCLHPRATRCNKPSPCRSLRLCTRRRRHSMRVAASVLTEVSR